LAPQKAAKWDKTAVQEDESIADKPVRRILCDGDDTLAGIFRFEAMHREVQPPSPDSKVLRAEDRLILCKDRGTNEGKN
jgi:hypothetical protein